MRQLAGQAARHTGRLVHALVQLVFAIVLTSIALLAVLSWRLSQGPLDLPWLAARMQAEANLDVAVHVTLGGAALAWEGFSAGVDRPFDIQVRNVVVTDPAGNRLAAVPRAEVSLSTGRLLRGQIFPRAVEIDGARLHVQRDADGDITFDLATLAESTEPPADAAAPAAAGAQSFSTDLLRELVRPAVGDHAAGPASRFSQLRHVRLRDCAVDVTDRQLGVIWGLHGVAVDLARGLAGGVTGRADADLKLGSQSAHLAVTADLDAATRASLLSASLGRIVPATLAHDLSAAAALAPLDVPVAFSGTAQFDPSLALSHLSVHADLASGALRFGPQSVLVRSGDLTADGTLAHLLVNLPRLEIAARPDAKPTVVQASADVARATDGAIAATATLDLDQVAFADLPALWPVGVGGPGTRPWITQNIPAGLARNGHVEVALTAPADLSDANVTRVAGGIDGEDLTIWWLRPVPPIEHGAAHVTFAGTESLTIAVTAGTQAGGSQGGIRIKGGRVTFSGLSGADQFADIEGDVAGTVPDLLTLLRHPRVKLLDRSPLPVKDAAGDIAGRVTVTHLPLRDAVTMDDVNIRTTARLTGLRLPGIAAGRDLDQGDLSVDAGPEGLHATGNATVAGLATQLQVDLDFRSGPGTQVLQKVAVSGRAEAGQLAMLGLDVPDLLSGSVGLDATYAAHRNGLAEAQIAADLAQAKLTAAALGLTKPAGKPAKLAATLRLDHNQVTEIAPLHLDSEGILFDGTLGFAAGKPSLLTMQHVVLGSGTDLHGTLRLPQRAGDAWQVALAGASLDASSQLERGATPAPPPTSEPPPGPAYVADLKLDRVLLGKGRWIADVVAHAENDGRLTRRAIASARTVVSGGGAKGGGAPFLLSIEPAGAARHLTATTTDAGALLLALDIDDKMQGGRMSIAGSYDDSRPDHPLAGRAEIDDFTIHNAPVLAKLLQAMTLYGLVDVVRGPGLSFSKLEAPFRYGGDVLTLSDARAFNASLGMTAKGSFDLARQSVDMTGTIVPAYFFNTLLGDIPLIGRLFSPERGGGLFAATYSVRGPLDDPNVGVNPLAALTPGFLRGVFGLLPDAGGPATAPPPTPQRPAR